MFETESNFDREGVTPGRILGLDVGEKRIGIAICDEYQRIARPYRVIKRSTRLTDFSVISHIVKKEDIVLIIIGLPYLLSGELGRTAMWIQDYAAALSQALGIQVELHDESFSTVDAEESLRLQGIKPSKKRQKIDALAAANILQSFLDSQASRR